MNGTTIVYGREQPRNRQYGPSSKEPLVTVRAKRYTCPISNITMCFQDQRTRYFLVHGQRVPINGQAFLDHCVRVIWPEPKIWDKEEFDIQAWLIERALDASQLPAKQVGSRWVNVTEFGRAIGLKMNFIQAIRQ